MAAPILKFKRGLLANLPVLNNGEPGFTTDFYDLYVGSPDGNKLIGSGRFWTTETASTGGAVKVYEATANGTNSISFAAPANIASDVTYTFPSAPTDGYFLKTNASGDLSWGEVVSNFDIAADSGTPDTVSTGQTVTFAGTGNEIETTVTDNQIQIGLTNDVTIGDSLTVTNDASVGSALTVTGALDVNGGADISGGETTLSSATVSDLTAGRVVLAGTSGALEDSGNLTYSGDGLTVSAGGVNVSGASTFSGGDVLISDSLVINGDLTVNGTETIINTQRLDVEDKTVGIASTSAPTDASANGAGIEVYGDTNYTFLWQNDTDSWEVNQHFSPDVGNTYDLGRSGQQWRNLYVDGLAELDDVNVSSAATIATAVITNATITNTTFGSGTAITSVDTDLSTVSASDDTLASAKAIKAYVDAQVTAQDLDFSGDSGTGAVDLDSQTLAINGTANEIVTSASGQTITIAMPDNVIVGGALTVTTDLTVSDSIVVTKDASVGSALTVTGALDVNGGADISGGETTLSSATISDLTQGRVVLAGSSGALEDSGNLTFGGGGLIVGAGGINVTGVSTFSTNVYVTGLLDAIDVNVSGAATVVGNMKIGSLNVNDAGGDELVITYTGGERILQNITVDAGAF
jgi:hypothetical protein